METLGDLLAGAREGEAPAVRAVGEPTVEYGRAEFVATAWKAANFFRHRGVHEGSTVAVVDDPAAPPLLAFFGAASLGAVTRFGPPLDVGARLLVGPGERVLEYDLPPGASRVAYTADTAGVEDPTVEAFGENVWSENPVEPPEPVDPTGPALATGEREYSHEELLDAVEGVVGEFPAGDEVAVRGSLAEPGVVVAGVLAPLHAGATVLFPGEDSVGDVAVGGDGEASEERVVSAVDL